MPLTAQQGAGRFLMMVRILVRAAVWRRLFLFFILNALSFDAASDSHRNYNSEMLEAGQFLFKANCAVCHGINAEGTVADWHKRDANGKLPPPPLNGTAHTWHHSISGLVHTVKNGTIEIGGSMPSWQDKLSDDEIVSIIIWLTSLWPEEVYNAWLERNKS